MKPDQIKAVVAFTAGGPSDWHPEQSAMSPWIIWPFFAVALVLALLVGLRPGMTRSREGRILAFAALFLLPVCAILSGFSEHMLPQIKAAGLS